MIQTNFSIKGFLTNTDLIRGNTVVIKISGIPTKSGLPFQFDWNLRNFYPIDYKKGTVSQSGTGTLATSTTTSLIVTFPLPSANYTLGSKHTFALQLTDTVSGAVQEGCQISFTIASDSVESVGSQVLSETNPSNFVRSVVLTGLSLVTGGVISTSDTVLQAFGKLQNQITNLSVSASSAWGSITGTLSAQTDLQNALNAKQNTITNSDSITQGSTNLFLTTGERTKLSNTTNTNSGDETNGTIIAKIGFTPENIANKDQNNGYSSLDSGGKVPLANLPSTLLKYVGVWNASTNTPTLTNPDTTKKGNVYNVSVAGTQFGISWKLGDWLIYNDSGVPEKSDNSDDVVSVNGQTGTVSLAKSDVGLSNVDNTSDINKPVSTATETALNDKVAKDGDTMTGKLTVLSEVEIKSSGIVGDNNGIIQKIENDGYGQGVFRWLFNNTSSFPLVASFFRTAGGLFDKVTFNGNIEANNLSNTNTGDETNATIKTKLGITTLSGVNTGDQDLSPYAINSSVVLKTGDTMTGKLNLPSTSTGSLNLNTGAKPTTIISGDVFSTSEGLFYQGSNLHQLDFDTSTTGALSKPVITDNGNGTVNVASVECFLFSGADWTGNYAKYVIQAVTNLTITDNSVNYLLISYNLATPIYSISTSPASVNGSSVVLAAKLFREGLEIHWLSVDWGLSTANRLNDREVSTDRYAWQTGLTLGETTGSVIDITAGVLWYGCTYFSKLAVNSSGNQAYFYSHSAGAWTKSSVSVYNNTQYDNGTDLATLSSGRYAVNWVYRIVDGDGLPGIAFILGSGNYTLSQAQASSVPAVPPMISQMAILVGRIIVQKNAVTATQIDSAFSTTFQGTVTANHNDLGGLQGGTANEYYHLTAAQLASIPKPLSVLFPFHGHGAVAVISQAVTASLCKVALLEVAIPTTVDAIQYTVGSVRSGNVRAGIYQIATANKNDASNTFTGSTVIADSGTVAQGTALQLQTLTFTPITLQPGKYFIALMVDNSTGTFMRHSNGANGVGWACGYTATGFAFTTPAPAPTDTTFNNVPGYKLRVVTNY